MFFFFFFFVYGGKVALYTRLGVNIPIILLRKKLCFF